MGKILFQRSVSLSGDINLICIKNEIFQKILILIFGVLSSNLIAQTVDNSISDFNRCYEINTHNLEAYKFYKRGIDSSLSQNDYSAIELFTIAIQLNPNASSFHESNGLSQYYTQQYKEAKQSFSKAIDIGPCSLNHRIYCFQMRARCEMKLKNYSSALTDLIIATNLEKNEYNLKLYWILIADCYYFKNDFDNSCIAIQKALYFGSIEGLLKDFYEFDRLNFCN
jgi:tetratricopeptide (TPR) repeat protein